MKIVATLTLFLLISLQVVSQFCYDTLKGNNKKTDIFPSDKFIYYSTAFLKFAKEKSFTELDTSCKGPSRAKAMLDKLDKGFECLRFSSGKKIFSIDSYCKQKEKNINFGLIEIVYGSSEESKKAFKIFSSRNHFKHYDKILRIYHPVLYRKRLIIFHTATPEDEVLKQFFYSLDIKNFILET
jgi:hypothetical protein